MAELILPDTAVAGELDHIPDHNKIVTAITTVNADLEAVETELGANPSGTYATVAARLAALTTPTATIDLPLSTLTGWTQASGTWVVSSSVIQLSVAGSNIQRVLRLDTRVGMAVCVVEVECRVVSGSGTIQRVTVGFDEPANFTAAYPVVHVLTTNDNGVSWQTSADTKDTTARGYGPSIAGMTGYGTWKTCRIILVGDTATTYVGGALSGNFTNLNGTANSQENRWLSLGGYNCVGEFRNLKVWDTSAIIMGMLGI